jgi:hypothetical protein
MPALFIYLIKVNIALLIFCLGYYAVLRHLTFYTLNRMYLVTAILFSALYPFINLSAFINRHQEIARPIQVVVVNWQQPAHVLVQTGSRHDQWYWLQMVFWAGVLVFGIRLATQLLSLYRLHKQSEPMQVHQYMIRVIKGDINPFSFWQSIYVNPANHPPHELDAILEHEQIHVNDWHTLDILLGEISAIFYWFNPGIWLMKRAIRENIEFITDRKILQKGIDCKVYQYSLINVNFGAQNNAIVNHFNISTIKKRIMMMNAKKSSSLNITRYMFLVPTVIVLLLVFSVSKAELNKAANNSTRLFNKVVKTAATKLNINPTSHALKHPGSLSQAMEITKPDTDKNKSVSISGNIITTKPDTIYYTGKNGAAMSVPVSGVVKKRASNKLSKTTAWTLNGVTYTKAKTDTTDKNKPITVKGTYFVAQPVQTSSRHFNGTYVKDKADTIKNSRKDPDETLKALIAKMGPSKLNGITKMRLNGVEITKDKMDSLLNVMRGWQVDKDGTVTKDIVVEKDGSLTFTGKPLTTSYFTGALFSGPIDFKNKLIIIDGKEATEKQLKKLSADKIGTISNMRRDTALSKYGDKAKNGVIIITTRKAD